MNAKTALPADAQIGARVAAIRRAHGLSQDALGAVLGVSFQQIQKYETGRNRISAGRLVEIAKRFNVSFADLYSEDVGSGDPLALELAAVFASIPDIATRRKILGVVKAMVSDDGKDS
jgi:transcriptional regulator with XRE-family HTH domain